MGLLNAQKVAAFNAAGLDMMQVVRRFHCAYGVFTQSPENRPPEAAHAGA